jgi:tail-anchored protein insertion receptor
VQAYDLYLLLTNSDLARRQRALKKDLLVKKAELLKLSPKDQFAKYFKLERNIKQALSVLEKLSTYCPLSCFNMETNRTAAQTARL